MQGSTWWRVLRGPQWWHFLALPLAAWNVESDAGWRVRGLSCARGVALTASCLAFAYGLNAITDRTMDLSDAKNPLVGYSGSLGSSRAAVLICALLALAIGGVAGGIPLIAAGVSLVGGFVYSAGPRLKTVVAIGTVCNLVIFAPLLVVGLPPGTPLERTLGLVPLLVTFGGLLLQNQLLHERADQDEDRGHVRSTASVLGESGTLSAIVGVGAVALGALFALRAASLLWLASALALSCGALAALPLSRPAAERRRRHRVVSVVAGGLVFVVCSLR